MRSLLKNARTTQLSESCQNRESFDEAEGEDDLASYPPRTIPKQCSRNALAPDQTK